MSPQEIIKKDNNTVLTPIITLAREDEVVVLIGMIHVASKEFFTEIQNRLCNYEKSGFQILYEEVEGIPSAEQEKLDLLFKGLEKYELYGQLNEIKLGPSWKSADFSKIEFEGINFDTDENNLENSMSNPEKYIQNILLPQLENPATVVPQMEILISKRNKVATYAILQEVKVTNVATFWGGAHLPGMITLLEQTGFKIDSTEWVRAIDLGGIKTKLNESAC